MQKMRKTANMSEEANQDNMHAFHNSMQSSATATGMTASLTTRVVPEISYKTA